MLQVYNTASRRKERFQPGEAGDVRMYVCGPTVYDYAHIGNARPVVVFDVLYRLLKRLYDKVTYVRNITDVEDKINAAAKAEGVSIEVITERTTAAFHQDVAALNALEPDVEPRATRHIAEMIVMIERLIERGHAYEAEGHVLFEVASMPDYGKFANKNADEMLAGARVEVAPYKKNPQDFVLWKSSSPDQPGWDSPWGRGRPGWHIECSAMAKQYLGVTFDIHGGGVDLVFPHHQNEIAQSMCAHDGAPLARYWMHNGYVVVEGEKMSKSLGNFITVRELREEFPGEAIRLALLTSQYRQPLDFSRALASQAKRTLDRWYQAADDATPAEEMPAAIVDALADDLNTPRAIAALHGLADRALKGDVSAARDLMAGADLLGVLAQRRAEWEAWQPDAAAVPAAEIERLIKERAQARARRDFAAADGIRDRLAARGILLEDGPDGTKWRHSA